MALAEIADSFDGEIEDLQWIVDAYAVTFAGLLLAGGALGDRIGRRTALVLGFGVFGLANLAAAFAGSVELLIGLRALGGIGAAIMMPATLATVSEVFPDHERPQAIATWASIAAAGGAFGPLLGGWLVTISGWQAVFVANGALALLGLVGSLVWVPRLVGQRRGRFDFLGGVLSVAAVACLVFVAIEGPGHPLAPSTLVAAAGAVAFTVAFVAHEARTEAPLLPLSLLADRGRVAGAGTLVLAALGFNGVFFVGALLLQIGWDESGLMAGLLLVPIGVVEVVVANVAVRAAHRIGVERAITAGLCCMAAGYLAMGFTPVGNRWWFIAAGVVAGVGNGLTIPLSVERIVGTVEPAFAGVAASLNDMSIELGASIGIGLLGAVQRVWFEAELPDGASTAISDVSDEVGRSAFRSASAAAFVLAAAVALLAIPIARSTRVRRRAPGLLRPA